MKQKHIIRILCIMLLSTLSLAAKAQNPARRITATMQTQNSSIHASTLNIQWRMYDRFDPAKANYHGSRYLIGYDRLAHQYQQTYGNPKGWDVELLTSQISGSNGRLLYKYIWKIDGINDQQGHQLNYHFSKTSIKDGLQAIQSLSMQPIIYQPSATAKMRKRNNQDGTTPPGNIHPIPTAFTFDTIPQFPALGLYEITVNKKFNNSRDTATIESQHIFITLRDYLVVVMGDSFNSGEGNPDFNGLSNDECWCKHETLTHIVNDITNTDLDMINPATWVEQAAHRSFKSGAVMAADQLEKSDSHSSVTLITVATSGAKIDRGLLFPQHCEWQLTGQIDEVKKYIGNRTIDFLLLSIGINELGGTQGGVSDVVIAAGDPRPPEFQETDAYKGIPEALRLLPDRFGLVNDKLKSTLKIKNTFLIQVPVNIFRDGRNQVRSTDDGLLEFLEYGDVVKIDAAAFKMADCQKNAAARYGWIYIDKVVDAFLGHGYFREYTSDSWFVQAEESCVNQGDWDGMIHPNGRGHAKIRDLVFDKLKFLIAGSQAPLHTE